jgi:formylglycine-generating enzyme required for sulfatase activity
MWSAGKFRFKQPCASFSQLGAIRQFLLFLIAVGFLGLSLLVEPGAAQGENVRVISPLATPDPDVMLVGMYGTVPPEVFSTTVALPLTFAQLPLHLPAIYFERANNVPTAPHPPDGATDQSPNVYLAWQLDEPNGSALRYEVYLDANMPVPATLIFAGPSAKMAFDPYTFATDTQYYWQVFTINERGWRVAGPIWTFRTEAMAALPDVEAMVLIPAGEFLMGCSPADNPPAGCIPKYQDTPQHAVYLDAYKIDKYEVTNLEYRRCVDARVCNPPRRRNSHQRSFYYGNPTYDYYPVLYVSWWDAQTFCSWEDKRLPTEAEWEKAARGPIDTRSWPWGEEFPDCTRLNYTDNRTKNWTFCLADTNRVGSYPSGASPYGVMDMAGNAFEWVADIWDEHYGIQYYRISPYENPTGPNLSKKVADNPYFTIRGGSYRPNWFYARVFHRHHGHHGDQVGGDRPYYRNDQVSFRCARSVDE